MQAPILGVAFNTDTLHFNSVASELTKDEALANSRVIGVVVAGLLGGYRLGIEAGLIAGLHRMTLGGFTRFRMWHINHHSGDCGQRFYQKEKI